MEPLQPIRPRDGRYDPASDQGASPPETAAPDGSDAVPTPPAEEVSYRVPTRFTVIKFAVAAVLVLAGVVSSDPTGLIVGLLVGAAAASYAARDLILPVRLAADRRGLIAARGYAGRVRLAWADIETVRVDSRLRFGRRSELLEIDAGEVILQFSEYDLGVRPGEVEQALAYLRASN